MKRINLEKSKVISQKNAEAWSDKQVDKNGFLKLTEGYFSNSADFETYDFALLFSVKWSLYRPFYGRCHESICGSHYAYFIPASDVFFEDE